MFSEHALRLRATLNFDSRRATQQMRSGRWNDETTGTWLRSWADKTPDKIAISGPSGSLSYAEVHDKALRLANALVDRGLQRGDTVAIQVPNLPEFLLCYFAVTMMGGVLSTLHMPYRSGEMAPLLNHAAARAVICGPASQHYDAPAVMLELQDRIEALQHVVVVGHTAPVGTVSLYDLIDGGSTRNIGNPPVASDPAILCFTSGTSSAPKAVVHNYHTMLSNNRVCADLYGITSDDVLLSAPPFTHAFGVCIINFALMSGATNLLMPLFTPDALAETIASDRPTLLFVAPAHVAACLNSGAFDACDLSSVRLATISGSACPYELAKAMDDRLCNGRVGQMWGMTETFMGLLTPFDASADLRYGTLGYPTPAVELRMVTTDGTDCGPGEEGEIQVRGCSVIPAYFDNEQANQQSFTADGWFKTGDLGVADENGIVVITGRVKDIINRGGIKINPLDIEALIDQHPSVMQSAMAPMPDPTLGERACLFVTLVPGTDLSLDEVCAYLAENQVAKMRWPERLEIIDAMPMTPTRKIIKAALVRLIG